MNKVLEIGEYTLEDGVTLERTGKFVTVRQIKGYDNKPRCYECKHFGHGRATKCGWTTTICMLQPKRVVDRDGKELYYHIGARRLACENFENKGTMSKAEKFISDCTKGCSNELIAVESRAGKEVISYHEWLTPDQARKAVEIAKEEVIEKVCMYLNEHRNGVIDDEYIINLNKAMKDE